MSLQTLIVFSPFLAVVYVLYGLIQALRRKEQGFIAALLAFITVAGTVAAYVITTDALTKARLSQFMLLNAIIVFVGSLLMLLLERRNHDRDMNRSYGMLGLGMSILLAVGIFATPLLSGALNTNQAGTTANNFGNGTLQTVRSFTPGARNNGGNTAESTQAAADTTGGGNSQLATVLTAQTGLSTDDLNTQVTGGATIAQLVSAHNGDANAVKTAFVNALDQLTASGSQGAQLLSRFGSDNSAIADQIIQGQLPAQFEPRIVTMLVTGAAPSFGGNRAGGNGSGGNGTGDANGAPANPPQAAPQPTAEVTAQVAPSVDPHVAQVLSDQTGLSADDLNTQIAGGSTIAQLVATHKGDLNAVTTAIAAALDQLTSSGGRTAQLLSRLGSDNATIASQLVQGQLPAQVQQRVVTLLITGAAPSANGNGGNGSGGGANQPSNTNGAANNPTPTTVSPIQVSTPLPPTATVARPTPIVFPTATDTPVGAAAAATTEATTSAATACTLIPDFNLNLRDKPNKDTGSVLVSIPLGTSVTADQKTSDGWYSVSYNGHNGWIDGQYASPSAACSSLPTASGN